jgi:hypothetical protein
LNWPGYYDVVILPPPAVRDYSIQLSRRFQGTWFLGKRRFLPHISLYHIPVRDRDFDAFSRTVRGISESTPWGWLETVGFDVPLLLVSKPPWLDRLQRRVVRRTLPYFDQDAGVQQRWSLRRFSGHRLFYAKSYLRCYGTPMHGMNFRPHITLSDSDQHTGLPFRRIRFRADALYICELGESHSCQRIVT